MSKDLRSGVRVNGGRGQRNEPAMHDDRSMLSNMSLRRLDGQHCIKGNIGPKAPERNSTDATDEEENTHISKYDRRTSNSARDIFITSSL